MQIKTTLTTILLSVLLFGTTYSQNPNFHIYICFGQSNMEGQGTIEPQDTIGNSRCKVMSAIDCPNLGRIKGNWYTATPPLCRCHTRLSPSDYFGKTMIENLPDSITIGIINVAVGGCNIGLFDKINYANYQSTYTEKWFTDILQSYNGNPYAHLIALAKLAQSDGVIKGILLHQGETNTGDTLWPYKVKAIYNNMLLDLNLTPNSIPLLAGEVVSAEFKGCCSSMNTIISNLPKVIPNAHVISSNKCTANSDRAHFDSEGYRKLGKRYAFTMLQFMGYTAKYISE